MARPRLPTEHHKATGADRKNPGRFKDRKAPKVAALGGPPEHLGGEERAAWKLFCSEFPWLGASDRTLVEAASVLRAKMVCGGLGLKELTELRQILVQMGGTPAARSKITSPQDDDDKDDPLGEFIQ